MKFQFDTDHLFSGQNPLFSKTVIFNALTALAEILSLPILGEIVPSEYRAHIAVAASLVNIYLRHAGGAPLDWKAAVTTLSTLVPKKTPPKP